MEEIGFLSPHKQISEDFEAEVVKVHDGDTIRLKTDFRDFDFPLRFLDTDAPEMDNGGEASRDWLKDRILGKKVTIIINRKNRVDKWGRLLGHVFHNGSNVGHEQMRLGLATEFGRRRQTEFPNLKKVFSLKQWV